MHEAVRVRQEKHSLTGAPHNPEGVCTLRIAGGKGWCTFEQTNRTDCRGSCRLVRETAGGTEDLMESTTVKSLAAEREDVRPSWGGTDCATAAAVCVVLPTRGHVFFSGEASSGRTWFAEGAAHFYHHLYLTKGLPTTASRRCPFFVALSRAFSSKRIPYRQPGTKEGRHLAGSLNGCDLFAPGCLNVIRTHNRSVFAFVSALVQCRFVEGGTP